MVRVIWSTPKGEELLVYMARVSNPAGQKRGDNPERLIRYLIRHAHWSPFEMVSMCLEIEAPRDITRQIIRHRSFVFQEMSQRYCDVTGAAPIAPLREARLQDSRNRQNSLPNEDEELAAWWKWKQESLEEMAEVTYQAALRRGIAKEVARAVLPEGLTMSRIYMAGNLRSWLHFCAVRQDPTTQKEARLIADEVAGILAHEYPATWTAFQGKGE